jgi:hypothetical protein
MPTDFFGFIEFLGFISDFLGLLGFSVWSLDVDIH